MGKKDPASRKAELIKKLRLVKEGKMSMSARAHLNLLNELVQMGVIHSYTQDLVRKNTARAIEKAKQMKEAKRLAQIKLMKRKSR